MKNTFYLHPCTSVDLHSNPYWSLQSLVRISLRYVSILAASAFGFEHNTEIIAAILCET